MMSTIARRLIGAALLFVCTGWFAACTPDLQDLLSGGLFDLSNTTRVAGEICAADPVEGAELSAVTAGGDVIPLGDLSDGTGRWGIAGVPGDEPLYVTAAGGTINGQPFDGTLSAYVPLNDRLVLAEQPGYDFQDIEINVMTTCVQQFMEETGADYETATERVAEFFEIPQSYDPIEDELPASVFSESHFLACAANFGGFDSYVDSLVDCMMGPETLQMLPPPANAVDIQRISYGRFAGEKLLAGIGGKAFELAFPYILAAVGVEQFEQKIERELSAIRSDLREINVSIDELRSDLHDSMSELGLANLQRQHESKYGDMQDAIIFFETQYNELLEEQMDAVDVADFVQQFKYQIKTRINTIDSVICGTAAAQKAPALDSFVDLLATNIVPGENSGPDLVRSYEALEGYFAHLLAAQMKGIVLQVNIYEYQDGRKGTTGSAAQYLEETVIPMIDKEVDYFVMAVERLVVKSADVRTVMIGDYSMFPRSAVEEVFRRADFYAHQLSSRHPAGLVLRFIGDRALLEDCLVTPSNAAHLGTPEITQLPVSGVGVRSYPPQFPDHFNTAYLAWQPVVQPIDDSGVLVRWNFSCDTGVAVARLTFPNRSDSLGEEQLAKAPYARIYQFPHKMECLVRYARYDEETGVELKARSDNEVLFGHAVVICRKCPWFGARMPKDGDRGYYHCETDANLKSGTMTTSLERIKRYEVFGDSWYSHLEEMLCGITNTDSQRARTLGFIAAAKHKGWTRDAWRAADKSGWYHYMNWRLKWHLAARTGDNNSYVLGYDKKNGDGFRAVRENEKSYNVNAPNLAGDAQWSAGETRILCSRVWNCLEAYAAFVAIGTVGLEEHKGATAHYDHEIEYLEIYPK